MLKKIPKKVWYQETLWTVRSVQSSKHDDFLILQCGTENDFEMICIDAQNQDFYPDSPKVRKIMEEILAARKTYEQTQEKYKEELDIVWLEAASRRPSRLRGQEGERKTK
jgi:hypothetical protein